MDPDSQISILISVVLVPLIVGYISGSVPYGLLIARFGGAGDVRKIGSGNIGATNVLRTGRKGLAALTLIADALKAGLVVWFFARHLPEAGIFAGLGAFLGHLFPIWLRFRGGKGIAVYIGALIGLSLPLALIFALVWLGTAVVTRYSSLSALLATLVSPLAAVWLFPFHQMVAIVLAVMTVLAWFMHRANISRLMNGTESKIGTKG